MRFIRFHVEITDHAMGASWTVDHTYHYSNKEFGETNIPDLERKFGREVIHAFAHHIGFFGRTITVSPVLTTYETRQPTLDEAKEMRGYRMIRLVEAGEDREIAEPVSFLRKRTEGA